MLHFKHFKTRNKANEIQSNKFPFLEDLFLWGFHAKQLVKQESAHNYLKFVASISKEASIKPVEHAVLGAERKFNYTS